MSDIKRIETLEQYFIDDYIKMREENSQLREQVRELELRATDYGYGITDLHRKVKTVRAEVASGYYFRHDVEDGNLSKHDVDRLLGIDDDERLFGECVDMRLKSGYNVFFIKWEEQTFQYLLMVKESRTEFAAITDGKPDSQLIKFDPECVELDTWVDASNADELKRLAAQTLRDELGELEFEDEG